VDFDDPHLRERYDGLDRVGDEVLANLGLLLDSHSTQCTRAPRFGVFQEMAWRRDSRWAMDERQGSAGDMRNDPLGDALKISSKLNLRYFQVWVDHSVGV
jgi:hypothetical protein